MSPSEDQTTRPAGPLLAVLMTGASCLAVFFWWTAFARRIPVPAALMLSTLGGRAAIALLAPRAPGETLRRSLGLVGVRTMLLLPLVLLSAAILPVMALQAALLGSPPFDWATNPFVVPLAPGALAARADVALALLAFGLVEPVATEALFRGWIQPALVRRWGAALGLLGAAALSAVAYAALAGFGRAALPAALTGFLLALLFGWVRQRTGSTPAAIVVHGLMGLAWIAPAPDPALAGIGALPLAACVAATATGLVMLGRWVRPAPESKRGSRGRAPTT